MNDFSANWGVIATIALVPLVLGFLLRTVRPHARVEGGVRILTYGLAFKLIGWGAVGIVLGCAALLLYVAAADRAAVLLLTGLFALLGLPILLEATLVRITFDEQGLTSRSPWRQRRVIPWSEVRAVDFSGAMQWWRLHTAQGVVRASVYLSGIGDLVNACKAHGFVKP